MSYKIVGAAFGIFNECGPGHKEKYYQNAMEIALKNKNLDYKREVYIPLKFSGQKVGKYFLDFLIEDKIIIEIKIGNHFSKNNIEQILTYLKTNNLKLGILINFTNTDIKFKRIVNLQ